MVFNLQEARESRNMSVEALAQLSGVSVKTILKQERGYTDYGVNVATAQQLTEALGYSDTHAIMWRHGVSNFGRPPGPLGATSFGGSSRSIMQTGVCGACFQVKSVTGACSCY